MQVSLQMYLVEMRSHRRTLRILMCAFISWLGLIAGGCESAPQPSRPDTLSDTPVDRTRTSSLTASQQRRDVHRVVSLAPSHTEWVFALGAQDMLIGRTDRCDFPPQASAISSVGTLFPPQLERILSGGPTDVLMIDGHLELKAQLRRFGVKVHDLQPHSLDEILTQVTHLGDLLGQPERAKRWVAQARSRLERLTHPTERPRVFIEIWGAPLTAAGAESFMGDLVRVAGGDVYPRGLGAWPTVSLERLITYDPDVILLSTKALYHELMSDPSKPWRSLKAVRHKRLYLLEGRLARPGPRVIDEIVWLNQLLNRASPAGVK